MEIILAAAYFLPIIFLMAFVGHEGKKSSLYLLWGFLASLPVYLISLAITPAMPPGIDPSLTVAPLLEEFFKALPIIIPAMIGIGNNDRDLLVCAMASGIGFSIIETGMVVNPFALPLTLENGMSVLARSFSTSLMHGCTCGIIGYGIVLIRNYDRRVLPALLFGFYTLAVTTHGIFNLLSVQEFLPIGPVIDFVFPLIVFFLLLICYDVDVPLLFKKNNAR